MTQEEMESAINFIVEHQAQFAADIQQLKEVQENSLKTQVEHQAQMKQLTEATVALVAVIGRLAKVQEQSDEKLAELQKRTDEKLAETDERLKIFINVVERFISSRNGESEG